MTNTVSVKVGIVPGAINEFVLNAGSTVGQALELAGLNATGYDIRMDGETVRPETVIPETAKVIVLVKQIKGNAGDGMVTVKVGIVPGAINEFAMAEGAKVGQALELAGLNPAGYDIRMDGETVTVDKVIPTTAKVIVLVKQIKGNAPMVKVGIVPGAINEYALADGAKVEDALNLAGLNPAGYDVRMDGETVSLSTTIPDTAKVIVLVKQIKGNRK